MFNKWMVLSFGTALAAAPVMAQERGSIEFGGFGSYTDFDKDYGVNNSYGFGGRVGAFVTPRVSLEFEGGVTRGDRDNGLKSIDLGVVSARLLVNPLKLGPLAILLGAGAEHSDNFALESYGFQGLVGLRLALSEVVSLRADGIQAWASNGDGINRTLHLGLSVFRHPKAREVMVHRTDTLTLRTPAMQHADSVSAAETRRLREADARYRALRDSLARTPTQPSTSAADIATMSQVIYFQRDESALSDSAKGILREKVTVFRSNPELRIAIVGFTSQPGTEAYNMALGMRRAEAAKAYLVAQGVSASRIDITTRGEGQLVVEGPGEVANAANRRGTFRLLLADPDR